MSPRLSGHPLEVVDQDPAGPVSERSNRLEDAIGRQVRVYRTQLGMTIANLARQAELSPGMLSKIENGQTSPSLTTLQSLAAALNVPVTALFRQYEQDREASFVKAGKGLDQREVVRFLLNNGEFFCRSLKIPDVLPIKENNWVVDDGLFRLSGRCL